MVGDIAPRLELPLEQSALVHHQHMGMFERPTGQKDGDGIEEGQKDGHHEGEDPKGGLFDSRKVFALYDEEYLIHCLIA